MSINLNQKRLFGLLLLLFSHSAYPDSVFQDMLKIGGIGPEMVVIPTGKFIMGSPPNEPGRFIDEGPTHQVTLSHPFAVSRYEISFAQYDQFVTSTQHARPSDKGWGDLFWGRKNMAVFNVSWHDAVAYTRWLSAQTGKNYRLLSESEWEYAARAGKTTAFSSGACITKDQANFHAGYAYSDCPITELYRGKMLAVGQFLPNEWGLHDVHGNAFEWTLDCWHENYFGAPNDATAWLEQTNQEDELIQEAAEADCNQRVLRGGSWSGRPRDIRFAQRAKNTSGFSSIFIGFRVAREITTR